jgi:dihydrolipoamide dehydrogenase
LGVTVQGYALDYPAVLARNERIITTLRRGLVDVLRREGVVFVTGQAAFEDAHHLLVTHEGASQRLEASRVIIASGARPMAGAWTLDERHLLSYRGLLALPQVPPSLLIIGGGVIGCEFASCFAMFGTTVTIVEQQPQLLPGEDAEAVRWLARRFEADGITMRTGQTVARLERAADGTMTATLSDGTSQRAHAVLVAIGQRPQIETLQLANAGVAHGRGVAVDAFLRTSQPHIAAIGDCVEGHGLAHWASAEGVLAARNLLGDPPESLQAVDVPRCIFTDPEIAHVGPLEKALGDSVQASRLSFGALGKSHCDEETDGFIKLLADRTTNRIRGATIVGAQASSLIHHVVVAIRHGLTAKQLARTITAHPTWPEAITEAAAHLYGESLSVSARRAPGVAAGRSR